ncbi:homogentisate 1,2-dioxygenase [Geothrix terrae]|uniref:homogentisate 1,2-dioxygenase n=1 Tax=Geothrix terrae TaxID=2922720 RepID=UPI001FACB549|nr:homogentisate 1,2-dioxygenase [Geothrix terrae]
MSKKETPLFPLRKGLHTRQAHVDLPAGTFEEEHARNGFFGRTTHLYRLHPVTDWTRIEGPLRPHSYDLNGLKPVGGVGFDRATGGGAGVGAPARDPRGNAADEAIRASMFGSVEPSFAPICILHNADVALHWVAPSAMDFFYRNADGDDVYYIHAGGGKLETTFGVIHYATGDYLVIPRGTTYRFLPAEGEQRYLLIEGFSEVTIPDRNQLGPNAIFDPAMVDTPELEAYDAAPREWAVHIKRENQITKVFYPFNPLDVVGWKGDLTVWRINVKDIRPVVSARYHLPPSAHSTFIANNFVICSFLPRPFEEEEGAMRVPFFHSNIDYDEVLFYSAGHFFSRDGIGAGMVTWHPQGIHHGPHPKAIPLSRTKDRTDEVAVMVDAFRPLKATPAAGLVENVNYWASWK